MMRMIRQAAEWGALVIVLIILAHVFSYDEDCKEHQTWSLFK